MKLSSIPFCQGFPSGNVAIRNHCCKSKTITLAKWTEFHDYTRLEQRFPLKVYFAMLYHSWERWTNVPEYVGFRSYAATTYAVTVPQFPVELVGNYWL